MHHFVLIFCIVLTYLEYPFVKFPQAKCLFKSDIYNSTFANYHVNSINMHYINIRHGSIYSLSCQTWETELEGFKKWSTVSIKLHFGRIQNFYFIRIPLDPDLDWKLVSSRILITCSNQDPNIKTRLDPGTRYGK